MMTAKEFLAPYKEAINSDAPELLITEILKIYPDSSSYKNEGKSAVGTPFDSATYSPVEAQVQLLLGDFDLNLTKDLTSTIKKQQAMEVSHNQSMMASNRVEQDSSVSQQFPEPEFNTTKFTSPQNLPDADSSLANDYPNTVGMINDAGDFFKVNKTTGDLQIVHRSGTCVKIDVNGNITIHSVGSVKQVVGGDLSIQAGGGIDIVAGKGIYLDTGSENLEIKTQSKEVNIEAQKITTKANKIEASMAQIEANIGKFTAAVSAAQFSGG